MGVSPCFFCPSVYHGVGVRKEDVVLATELCDTCRSNLRGFRLWLRDRCSTLRPLDAEQPPEGG